MEAEFRDKTGVNPLVFGYALTGLAGIHHDTTTAYYMPDRNLLLTCI